MGGEVFKIKIFGDSPTIEDQLGFKNYADILSELIENFDAKSPLTIGIHGGWGSGKTSLMRMLEKKFTDKDNIFKTIWFNAWAYARDEPIGLVLLQQILIEFQKDEKYKEKIKKLIESSGKLFADYALRNTIGMSFKEVKDFFKSSIEVKSTLRADFETAIDDCLQDRRLVVFIDDLDRCLPEKTIEIIEMIKLFLDVPKCIFVIGVEKDVIERGIEVIYKSKGREIPISGKDYIEKIIQVPFTLPPIREGEMASFIENLGIEEREKGYIKIVAKGTGCNPRKVKMFLNTLRIRQAITERTGGEIKPELSAKLFVFEYVLQDFYKDIVKYRKEDFLYKLERLAKDEIDEELKKEFENSEILKKYYGNDDIRNLLKDEPSFRGMDLEPYIYLSPIEMPPRVIVSEDLLNELLSRDFIKVAHAAEIIRNMPDSERPLFFDVVISKLKDEDKNMRRSAAMALGKLGGARAVDPLIEALKDEEKYVRENAAWALGNLGDLRAVDPLIKALDDKYKEVRGPAAISLGNLGDLRAVDPLIMALKDQDMRGLAAWALGKLSDARAVDPLIEALKDDDLNVRANASVALGNIGDAIAIDPLIKALKDTESYVRGLAAVALGNIGDMRAVNPLIEVLDDAYESVRANASEALRKIKHPAPKIDASEIKAKR